MIVYDEPGPDGTDKRVRITEQDARVRQARSYNKSLHPLFPFMPDDPHMLDDFLVNHGAWVEED